MEQEEDTGKFTVNYIFYPKNNINKLVIILEFKIGDSTEKAIDQIYERQNYMKLKKVIIMGKYY